MQTNLAYRLSMSTQKSPIGHILSVFSQHMEMVSSCSDISSSISFLFFCVIGLEKAVLTF